MPHKVSASALANPKVATASVQEGAPMRHAPYGGGKKAHARQSEMHGALHKAPHPKSGGGGMISAQGAKAARKGQAPPASSLNGTLGIIEHPSGGKDREMGIPGIISSTSLGPEQRQRIVSGIIESPMGGVMDKTGAVHAILGHDSTAYNAGMRHIPGSHFK